MPVENEPPAVERSQLSRFDGKLAPLHEPQLSFPEQNTGEEASHDEASDQQASWSETTYEDPGDAVSAVNTDYTRPEPLPPQEKANKRLEILPWPQQVLPLYKQVSRLQDRYFTMQTKLTTERSDLKSKQAYFQESTSSLMQVLEPPGEQISDSSHSDRRKEAYAQLVTDREAFDLQLKIVDKQEKRLSNLEYELAKLQPELIRSIEAHFDNEQENPTDGASSDSSYSVDSTPAADSLQEQYYKKRGEFRLLHDRLNNHLAEVSIALDDEDAPYGTVLGVQQRLSGDFQDLWTIMHDKICKDLQAADEELTNLWNECQAANLDVGLLPQELQLAQPAPGQPMEPEDPSVPADELNAPPFWPYNPQGLLPAFFEAINWAAPRVRVIPRPLIQFAGKENFIRNWVGGLPSKPVEFEHALNSTQSEPDWTHVEYAGDDAMHPTDLNVELRDERAAPIPEQKDPGAPQKPIGLRNARSDSELRSKFLSVPLVAFHRRSHDAT